jgi:hypothetical protein
MILPRVSLPYGRDAGPRRAPPVRLESQPQQNPRLQGMIDSQQLVAFLAPVKLTGDIDEEFVTVNS